jgi:CDP-glycerol glycerophosphotransferase
MSWSTTAASFAAYTSTSGKRPGALLATPDEVIDALRALDRVTANDTAADARFRERSCDLDDRKAAGRVVDKLLGER